MRNATHIRLSVFLLNGQHVLQGAALAEGEPRYAVRKAMEHAVRLTAQAPNLEEGRLVIIPTGHGSMVETVKRAQAMSKAGICTRGLDPLEVRKVGRRAALMDWAGTLANQVRADRARPVQGERLH